MLGKLFGGKSGKSDDSDLPPISSSLASTILGTVGITSIPFMPNTAQQAFKLSTNPKAELRDFVDVIESDESLSARVIKVANSVYFDRGHPSRSVADAVNVIGLGELKGLLNAQAVTQMFPSKSRTRTSLWANAVGTAIGARVIAALIMPSCTDQAFLAGLLHDVGKLLLLQRNPDIYEKICKRVQASGCSFVSAEADVYPFDHTQVGQLIGDRWNFTKEIKQAIRLHHQPWAEQAKGSLTALVKAADLLSYSCMLGLGSEFATVKAEADDSLADARSHLGISAGNWSSLESSIKRTFESEFELYASWGG